MNNEEMEEALDAFTRQRTMYSGAMLVAYLAVVAYTESLLVAISGAVVVLVVRSWAIDRILFGTAMETNELLRALAIREREDSVKHQRALVRIARLLDGRK